MIDWTSSETHLLLNPRLPAPELTRLEDLQSSVPSLRAHVWLATSGTTGSIRLVALSKDALLASARSVNALVDAKSSDSWLCVLPQFHVGGLAIYARAFVSGSRVVESQWAPEIAAAGGYTLTSLVPAQVVDLIHGRVRVPPGVRAVFVGGGRLAPALLEEASGLGWPLYPTYGMTEASSQIATSERPGNADLKVLPHIDVALRDGAVWVRGASLMTAYADFDERGRPVLLDPKQDGWLPTGDRGALSGGFLEVAGRGSDFIKVGGESVDLVRLDGVLETIRGTADVALFAAPDDRLGHVVALASAVEDASSIVRSFNDVVAPFERIRLVRPVASVPRTALGKVRRAELASVARGTLE